MGQTDTTSWNLLANAAAGQDASRAEFARRYGPAIRLQLEQRWRQEPLRQHIGDAIQEVFLECLKPNGVLARADPTAPEGFRRLLAAVVRNVALRVETRLARQRRRDGVGPDIAPDHAASQ